MAVAAALFVFVAVLAATAAFGYVRYVRPSQLLDQLSDDTDPRITLTARHRSRATALLSGLGNLLPLSPADFRLAQSDLEAAGFRSDSAVAVFSGSRVVCAATLCLFAALLQSLLDITPVLRAVIVICGALGGCFLPDLALEHLANRRRQSIRVGLPDALDLLVICTEAGSALDQSLVTVTRELAGAHPELCEELKILTLEMLAGKTRRDAMHNFAARTGEDEVKKLVALMVQTDRFGTSMADALRAQSESMRIRRHQLAEERAGKIGVKLVFPIFFFCLPSLFIIAAGPGMLQLFRSLPMLNGGH